MTEIIITASIHLDEFTREDTTRELFRQLAQNGRLCELKLSGGRRYDITVTGVREEPGVVTDRLIGRIADWLRVNPAQTSATVAQYFRITRGLASAALLEGAQRGVLRQADDVTGGGKSCWFAASPEGASS